MKYGDRRGGKCTSAGKRERYKKSGIVKRIYQFIRKIIMRP
jgi:hypothetical protein